MVARRSVINSVARMLGTVSARVPAADASRATFALAPASTAPILAAAAPLINVPRLERSRLLWSIASPPPPDNAADTKKPTHAHGRGRFHQSLSAVQVTNKGTGCTEPAAPGIHGTSAPCSP